MELGLRVDTERIPQGMMDVEIADNQGGVKGGRKGKLGGNSAEGLPVSPNTVAVHDGVDAGAMAKQGSGMNLQGSNIGSVHKNWKHHCLLEGGSGNIKGYTRAAALKRGSKRTKAIKERETIPPVRSVLEAHH